MNSHNTFSSSVFHGVLPSGWTGFLMCMLQLSHVFCLREGNGFLAMVRQTHCHSALQQRPVLSIGLQ